MQYPPIYAKIIYNQFEDEYARTKRKAFVSHLMNHAIGRAECNQLLSFATYYNQLKNASRLSQGIQLVCVNQIKGSLNRHHDFDANFTPKTEESKVRWLNIREAYSDGRSLPPVNLHKIGDIYFVEDGHHRVSVARFLGQEMIEAHVTEYETGANHADC